MTKPSFQRWITLSGLVTALAQGAWKLAELLGRAAATNWAGMSRAESLGASGTRSRALMRAAATNWAGMSHAEPLGAPGTRSRALMRAAATI
jgi:hypothetical protein